MEDWEDEPAPLVLKKELPKNLWDDEDVDENDVKDSWEDEDEPAPAPVAEPPAEKPPKKSVAKGSEKRGKAVEVVNEEPLDPVAEKLRQQRLVEEADYKNTTELFAKKGGDDNKSLENFIPKSESDFLEYAELISHKLRPYEKSFHYIGLLKAVMRLSMTSLKAADAKEVASSVTAIANEKLKAEKEANAGKKKSGPKKKQLIVDKPDDDAVVNKYDTTYDDYDFITFTASQTVECRLPLRLFQTSSLPLFGSPAAARLISSSLLHCWAAGDRRPPPHLFPLYSLVLGWMKC